MLSVCAENRSLRQPSCSGNSAVSLTPFVRCDVRALELQSGELYWSSPGYVNIWCNGYDQIIGLQVKLTT